MNFNNQVTFSYTGVLADGIAGGFQICSGDGGYNRKDINVSASGDATFEQVTTQC